jgi:hypothetical protein
MLDQPNASEMAPVYSPKGQPVSGVLWLCERVIPTGNPGNPFQMKMRRITIRDGLIVEVGHPEIHR